MTIPGVGPITALSFKAGVDEAQTGSTCAETEPYTNIQLKILHKKPAFLADFLFFGFSVIMRRFVFRNSEFELVLIC
jgi:hypothetical protein